MHCYANFEQAWKARLGLTLNHGHNDVVNLVQQAWEQPGVNDIRLLSYLYQILAEATRRDQGHNLNISGVGDGNLKVWQRAAKALGRKEDRQELWSALGQVALAEECWEDFRLVSKKSDLGLTMRIARAPSRQIFSCLLHTAVDSSRLILGVPC